MPARSTPNKFPAVCYIPLRKEISYLHGWLVIRLAPIKPEMKDVTLESAAGVRDGVSLPDEVRKIFESQTFERTPALRCLLAYLWEHRTESLSEYAIATEALHRSPSFDARIDATVRVQVSRLRQRLERYYEKEDAKAGRRLLVPLGTHQLVWDERSPALAAEEVSTEIAIAFPELTPISAGVEPQRTPISRVVLAVLCLLCIAQAGYLIHLKIQMAKLEHQAPRAQAPRFWRTFFGNQHPTRIALPTPVFFSFGRGSGPNRASVMLRDTEINEFAQGPLSSSYQQLTKSLGPPALAESYTVTSDTFAAIRLARYLDGLGLQTAVTSSADDPTEALDRENLVAVGTWGTLEPLSSYLQTMSFALGAHESSVILRDPSHGEPKRIESVAESQERGIWPGVIGFLPSRNGSNHLLVLAGRHTSALVSFLTSSTGLDQLEQLWRKKGCPQYFEVVVSAELSGRGIVRTWPVALHPYLQPK